MRVATIALVACVLAAPDANAQAATQQSPPKLTGRAVDENGKPIAGAAVGWFLGTDVVDTATLLVHPQAVTGDDGSYAIPAKGIARHGTIVLAAKGRQSCALDVMDPRDNGTALGETVLVPGIRLQGRVRDAAGAPLAGAWIRVENGIPRGGTEWFLLAGTVTGRDGIFVVPGVPATGLRVTAGADGYLPSSRLFAQDSPADLTLTKVGVVRGKIVDAAGAPVAGVTIEPITVEVRAYMPDVASAADGTFTITVPSRGRFRLSAYQSEQRCRFTSGLLHGAADGVLMEPVDRATNARTVDVRVVDAATGQPIQDFWWSQQRGPGTEMKSLLFQHGMTRTAHSGPLTFADNSAGQKLWLIVDAPGHAFEVVQVPERLEARLEVPLGPEAVLVGKVTDVDTGKPLAGVAIRAVPKGRTNGGGGRAEDAGPLTNADGEYRVGSLRAGEYEVQAHGPGRPNTDVSTVTVTVEAEARLDLKVPSALWLDLEVVDELPDGPACRLSRGSVSGGKHIRGALQHMLAAPPPVCVSAAGPCRLGPVLEPVVELLCFVPSRIRAGAGTTISLGQFQANVKRKVSLADLTLRVVQGKVRLESGIPSERLAVVLLPVSGRPQLWPGPPTVAGIDSDGRFALDVPAGTYRLQLVDAFTGIVCHTEEHLLEVGRTVDPVTLTPRFHWLEVECRPTQAKEPVFLHGFTVRIQKPSDKASAFLGANGSNGILDVGEVGFRDGDEHQRWLVADGSIEVKPQFVFEMLRPGSGSYAIRQIDGAECKVTEAAQKLVLDIPPAPSDAELLQRTK